MPDAFLQGPIAILASRETPVGLPAYLYILHCRAIPFSLCGPQGNVMHLCVWQYAGDVPTEHLGCKSLLALPPAMRRLGTISAARMLCEPGGPCRAERIGHRAGHDPTAILPRCRVLPKLHWESDGAAKMERTRPIQAQIKTNPKYMLRWRMARCACRH